VSRLVGSEMCIRDSSKLIAYQNIVTKIMTAFPKMIKNASPISVVTKVIYEAATDGKSKLRYMAGRDAKMFDLMKNILGYNFIYKMNNRFFKL
jgi:hypothetical protein